MTGTDPQITCIAPVEAVLGEGPVWLAREQALFWTDIAGQRLYRWSQEDGVRRIDVSCPVCWLVPRAAGGFVAGGYGDLLFVDDAFTVTVAAQIEPHRPGNRFNDAKVDKKGRLWAGTMDRAERMDSGTLYRIDPDLSWCAADDGYRVPNGPAFSLDGRTMFHADSARRRIYAYDLTPDGMTGNRRVHLQFDDAHGFPDGMTIDADGCLWVAFWDGWCVRRFAPDGRLLAELAVPVQRPTSVTFGGAALDRLFITSARRDLSDEVLAGQPLAGGTFMLEPGVRGVAEPLFAG
ncbi:SMP-30/gluconolactonase/LRE family protein [Erythrobacteraceae bacterium CFH 75059]|uniref:SMP-30/gluconolactonase/LRE family protein n=1 Tax=Qipengyuania thermophila TaxID=2509361 RepID=UPI0010216420|nr:SMP-30/gluconolactonase/LRE family protein [Qipengyuania thermophila]TCD01891.1 SMP-30/gluconolactonase/LRE family protein [Erythrobacteraceae bacterium CFH 75059]